MILSVVIPFYKCRAAVRPMYHRLLAACGSLGTDLEFLFVEDCGEDGTWEILEELAASDSRVKAVQLSRNFGQHHALAAGLDLCTGDWVVTMDCDLQDRPEDIPRLFEKAREGYDVVYARRRERKAPLLKGAASRLFHRVFRLLSGVRTDPEGSSFRLMSEKVLKAFRSMGEQIRVTGLHLRWLGFPAAFVEVEHSDRCEGPSSYSLGKLLSLGENCIAAYSNRPLRISIGGGLFILLFSCAWAVRLAAASTPSEPWTKVLVSLWMLGGMILLNLGLLGLYLGKVFEETKRRPLYVISKKINL